MSYTSHGHHVPGTPDVGLPIPDENVARCGGPGVCSQCSQEAFRIQGRTQSIFGSPTTEELDQQQAKERREGTANTENPILRYFAFDHLPERLRDVSAGFFTLAHWVDENVGNGAEKSVALRKLLEAKDAAVRAAL